MSNNYSASTDPSGYGIPAVAMAEQVPLDPIVVPPAAGGTTPEPVKVISPDQLRLLGQDLMRLFAQYNADRRIAELKWIKNLRQFLGIYDPEIESQLSKNRSQAYPKLTRIKCISTLSRIMNLMFPGDEKNWDLHASPSPDLDPDKVQEAIQKAYAEAQADGRPLTEEDIEQAVQRIADEAAEDLVELIDDQLQEIGGDQTQDFVSLNRKVLLSGIMYGLGLLKGPFARTTSKVTWVFDPNTGMASPTVIPQYKPMLEFLPVWDFYPDMAAKTLGNMDGYFIRSVMSRSQVRDLANRSDFLPEQVKTYLKNNEMGNYKAQPFETELRSMGVKVNVNEQKADTAKYEVITWYGTVKARMLVCAGVEIPEENMADDIEAEVWMIDGNVIKADMNPWRKIGEEVRTIHPFVFEEDDTAPVGNGLPNVMRDSQMAVAAAARMLLDNASVVCGPNLELNTDLLRADQDITSVMPYKIWYREGLGPEAQFPAVRNIQIDSHIKELTEVIRLFMEFADAETFVGPATGGDMSKGPSEPFRTAAGASLLKGDAALPFKDIVRNFDFFTQSVINALVKFNKKFNPQLAQPGDYNVIARGATSLMAKEVRGIQVDTLATTLTPNEMVHVDERKLVEARLKVRDLNDVLVPEDEAKRRQAQQAQDAQEQKEQAQQMVEANVRKLLSDAFKNITQGQKNNAAADATTTTAALQILEKGMGEDGEQEGSDNSGSKGK